MSPETSTTASVLTDLAWETLANELEAWLDGGHRPPFPGSLRTRPEGMPPEHLRRRLAGLSARLDVALGALAAERDGLEAAVTASVRAARMTAPARGSTPAFLDTGA